MQVVTIDSLLTSALPCSSSSRFPPESSSNPSVISPGETYPPLASENIQNVLGKISQNKQRVQRKGGTNCQMIKVLPQCWVLVGRLQLCNRDAHYWNGLFVPADCVALTDSTATICCCICQGPDPSFLGNIVRVTSWNFISQKGVVSTGVQSSGALNSGCQPGVLEIHSLELVEGQPSEEPTLPPFFVTPPAGQRDVTDIPIEQQERQGRRLTLRGITHCISPPFILPCKSSGENGQLASQPGSSRMQEREGRHNEKFSGDPMLGFFIEIQLCSGCSPSYFGAWENPVKRELSNPRKLDEIWRSIDFPGKFPGVSTKTEGSKTTTQPVDENLLSSSKPSEVAWTPCLKTRLEAGGSYSHVYFSGPVAAWRPVLSGALGRCVTITCLIKKLILVGSDKRPHSVYLATPKSLVTLDCERELLGGRLERSPLESPEAKRMHDGESPMKKSKQHSQFGNTRDGFRSLERDKDSSGSGQGDHMCMESGNRRGLDRDNGGVSFVGIVTDSLFQGTLLELDERVWLLLTHQRHTKLRGLRIGAMLSLREVHPITIKDAMGKSLLLGACMHSHVSVVLFSPFLTQTSLQVHSKSLLLKHIQCLSFTSTFWVLSLIGSFRQKFRDIYSNKELFGAKKDPGIIQKYAQRMIAPDETLERVGSLDLILSRLSLGVVSCIQVLSQRDEDLVNEFFHRQTCKLGGRGPSTPIMQVPPIANFCEHVQALWQTYRSVDTVNKSGNPVSSPRSGTGECEPMRQSRQLTITSEELGIILLGSLQVRQTSGKLYLVDATGIIEVVIPDILSSEHLSRTYQVSRFTLKMEGLDQAATANLGIGATFISWSSLLKEVKAVTSSERVKYVVHFFIRDATYLHDLDRCEYVKRLRGPVYHSKETGWRQKQMQGWWSKTKSHLDFLRLWFQSQTAEVASIRCSNCGLGVLSEHVGHLVPSDHLFKANCKVVAVRLLVLEWPCGLSSSEVRNTELQSWLGAKCASTSRKPPFGMPLTLACFVVDDGSGPADCWALGDAAVSLLGLANVTGPLNLPDTPLERICTNLARVFDMQLFVGLSLEQILCRMTQKHGAIVLQSSNSYGDSTGSCYLMNSKGGRSLDDDERSLMHLVVTSACRNGPSTILCRNIPSMENICSADPKKEAGSCEVLACCSPHSPNDPSFGRSKVSLLAHRVDPINYVSDLATLTKQVVELL